MSILESIIFGFLFGAFYKLLFITKEHKKRLDDIQKEVETLQKNYWEMISENEADD